MNLIPENLDTTNMSLVDLLDEIYGEKNNLCLPKPKLSSSDRESLEESKLVFEKIMNHTRTSNPSETPKGYEGVTNLVSTGNISSEDFQKTISLAQGKLPEVEDHNPTEIPTRDTTRMETKVFQIEKQKTLSNSLYYSIVGVLLIVLFVVLAWILQTSGTI